MLNGFFTGMGVIFAHECMALIKAYRKFVFEHKHISDRYNNIESDYLC